MTTFKRSILYLFIVFILLTVSCSDNGESSKKADSSVGEETVQELDGTIRVYKGQYDIVLQTAVDMLRIKHPKVEVEVNTYTDYEELDKKLGTELLAGSGPDVIKWSSVLKTNLTNAAGASGIFYDLNTLISKDKSFNLSDYNEKILECGVKDDKRFFIPIGYKVPVFYSTSSALARSGIETDMSNWTLKQLADFIRKYKEKNPDKYFFVPESHRDDRIALDNWWYFVDYDKKAANFDSDEFVELLKAFKDINNGTCNSSFKQKYRSFTEPLREGSIVSFYSTGRILNPGNLWMLNSEMNEFVSENVEIFTFPSNSGNKQLVAEPTDIIAINKNSKNKDAAFELVKILLSKEIQTSNWFQNMEGIPVNKNAIEEMLQKYSGKYGEGRKIGTDEGVAKPVPLTKELRDRFIAINNLIGECKIRDLNIQQFIEDEVSEYLSNKCTAEQAAKKIQQKVMLYLNE